MKKRFEMCFNLRISEELNEKIKLIAEKERRSKNQEIEYILEEYVKKYENENQKIQINQEFNDSSQSTINFNK